ncbi:DUF3795 domain-containing protein [bacterium]|nr:DUF3795 domain-containing protein [bacterium]
MKEITADKTLVAYCGLYCGACKKYRVGKCPGCHKNSKASWCKVRSCCLKNGFTSCADCKQYTNIMDCKWFNNFIAKAFGFVFNSDRNSCIQRISEVGIEVFSQEMTENGTVTHKRKK